MNKYSIKTKDQLKKIVLISLMGLISACGFHLRGQSLGEWPAVSKQFGVQDKTGQAFWWRLLLPALQQQGVKVEAAAPRQLILQASSSDKKIASYDATGRAAQYTLTETLSFSFQSPVTEERLSVTQLKRQRTYDFNTSNLSGKTQEERLIQQELRQQLIQSLMARLQQHLSQPLKTSEQLAPELP